MQQIYLINCETYKNMYTVDYLKTLHADYVEWNTDPGGTVKSFQVKDPSRQGRL